MSADTVCRVCLVKNLNLYGVHIDLQNVYEKITRQKFNKVGYPVCMCYICLSALRKCHRFMETARDANGLLTQWCKQQNELGVTKPLSTYSTTKIVLVSANEDISSEHDIKQENEDLAEQLAGDIETEYSECNIAVDIEKTDVDEPTDDSTMLVDSSTVTEYNDTTQVSDDKHTDPLFITNMDNDWSGLDMVLQHNNDICQITEVKSEIVKNEETQLLSAEIPKDLHTEIEIDETDEGDADDVCHTENFDIKFNPKPKILNTKSTQNRKTLNICDVCDKCCASAGGLKRHVVLKHSTTQKLKKLDQKSKTFSCSVCSYKCTRESQMTRHTRTHTRGKLFPCDICDYKCTYKSNLTRHIRTHTGDKPFSCDVCDYKFTDKSNLIRHITTHNGERSFSCEICDYKCTQKPTLTLHIRNHTGEKLFSCDVCDYTFTLKSALIRHIRTHTGEKPYSCDMCDYKCIPKSSLSLHIRTHTGEKPFSCNICSFKCAHKLSLKRHIKTHTREKPFSCNICGYKYAHKLSLTRHIRTHTGEKPFSCDICGYKSAVKSTLIRHIRTHTAEKPYSCDKCHYKCTIKSYLTRHTRTHTEEKPFSCNICSYKCARKTNLNKHLVQHKRNKRK